MERVSRLCLVTLQHASSFVMIYYLFSRWFSTQSKVESLLLSEFNLDSQFRPVREPWPAVSVRVHQLWVQTLDSKGFDFFVNKKKALTYLWLMCVGRKKTPIALEGANLLTRSISRSGKFFTLVTNTVFEIQVLVEVLDSRITSKNSDRPKSPQ